LEHVSRNYGCTRERLRTFEKGISFESGHPYRDKYKNVKRNLLKKEESTRRLIPKIN
jgi:hypothetical protein